MGLVFFGRHGKIAEPAQGSAGADSARTLVAIEICAARVEPALRAGEVPAVALRAAGARPVITDRALTSARDRVAEPATNAAASSVALARGVRKRFAVPAAEARPRVAAVPDGAGDALAAAVKVHSPCSVAVNGIAVLAR